MNAVIVMKQFLGVALTRAGRGQAGQAYTEYGLILVLIGVTVIGALTIMGGQVFTMWHSISAAMPH
jgi:Flp pilus assembly pilin Flp